MVSGYILLWTTFYSSVGMSSRPLAHLGSLLNSRGHLYHVLPWQNEREYVMMTDSSGSKRHSLHVVDLSQWYGIPCATCVYPSRPQQWLPDYRFLCKPAMQTCWMAGNAPHKSGLYANKSGFSISATDKYRYLDLPLTPTPPSQTLSQATHPTLPQPKHRHISHFLLVPPGLVNPKPNPLTHSPPTPPTLPRAKHIHLSPHSYQARHLHYLYNIYLGYGSKNQWQI